MDKVTHAFTRLANWWNSLDWTTLPDWASAIGTVAAVFAAIWLQSQIVDKEGRQIKAKRAYLSVLLFAPIEEALRTAKAPRNLFDLRDRGPTAKSWIRFAATDYATMPEADPLLDLHEHLIETADEGDDKIAGFIEAYRSYKRVLGELADLRSRPEHQQDVVSAQFENEVGRKVNELHTALTHLEVRGRDAKKLLEDRLPPVEVKPFAMRKVNRESGQGAASE